MTIFHTPNYVGPEERQCGDKRRYYDKATAKTYRDRLRGQARG